MSILYCYIIHADVCVCIHYKLRPSLREEFAACVIDKLQSPSIKKGVYYYVYDELIVQGHVRPHGHCLYMWHVTCMYLLASPSSFLYY